MASRGKKTTAGVTGISGGNQSPWANREVEISLRLKQGGHTGSEPHWPCWRTRTTRFVIFLDNPEIENSLFQSLIEAEVVFQQNTSAGCKPHGKEPFGKLGAVLKISWAVTGTSPGQRFFSQPSSKPVVFNIIISTTLHFDFERAFHGNQLSLMACFGF